MEEIRDYLARIHETLRYQQGILFQLTTTNQALEMIWSTMPGYHKGHAEDLDWAATPERIQEHAALMAALSLEIAHLRGENPTIGDA
jgi:hypothetical protein